MGFRDVKLLVVTMPDYVSSGLIGRLGIPTKRSTTEFPRAMAATVVERRFHIILVYANYIYVRVRVKHKPYISGPLYF